MEEKLKMKINEVFAKAHNNLWENRGFQIYDILEWKLLFHRLNLRDGEIVKITIEKLKEI